MFDVSNVSSFFGRTKRWNCLADWQIVLILGLTGATERGILSIGTDRIKGSYQVTKVTTYINETYHIW